MDQGAEYCSATLVSGMLGSDVNRRETPTDQVSPKSAQVFDHGDVGNVILWRQVEVLASPEGHQLWMQELGLVLMRSDELGPDETEVELVQALDGSLLLRTGPDRDSCIKSQYGVQRAITDSDNSLHGEEGWRSHVSIERK